MDETNVTPPVDGTSSSGNLPTPPKPVLNKRLAVLLGILILMVLAAGAFWLKQRVAKPTNTAVVTNPTPTPEPTPNPDGNYGQYPKADDTKPTVNDSVAWIQPKQIAKLGLFKSSSDPESNFEGNSQYFQLGTFTSGKYNGDKLLMVKTYCQGPCPLMDYRVVQTGSKFVFLVNHSDYYDDSMMDATKVSLDSDYRLAALAIAKTISGPAPRQVIERTNSPFYSESAPFFDSKGLKVAFHNDSVGNLYTDDGTNPEPRNGFYLKLPDNTEVYYKLIPDFVPDTGIPDLSWTSGGKNTKQYTYIDVGSCGGSNYISVIPTSKINITQDLVQTGTNSKGEVIYELKDKNNPILKDVYDNQYSAPYDYQNNKQGQKVPYDQFVAVHPVFFWVDPFGRLIKFTNNDFQPQAECAKPVIYLYPQKSEKVFVKLAPTGGFSYTEPAYLNGWEVTAEPSGNLTTADGKTYPYLFWEGRSNEVYQTPQKGFLVAKADVHAFLNDKLAKLGLNSKETADFEQYWEPYMQSSPYYFVTFMGNTVLDRIAPLAVTPTPDTIIRILMDFEPLDKPIAVQGYDIKTPVRKGFTVIEWGGVKH